MKRISPEASAGGAPAYVLDAYALLCYLQDEAGADEIEGLLEQARAGKARLLVTWMNLGEVYYRVSRTAGENKAVEVLANIKEWPVTFLPGDETLAVAAARWSYSGYGRPGNEAGPGKARASGEMDMSSGANHIPSCSMMGRIIADGCAGSW